MLTGTEALMRNGMAVSRLVFFMWMMFPLHIFGQGTDQMAARDLVQFTEQMLMGSSGGALDTFIESKLSTAYRTSNSIEAMRDHLRVLRAAVAGAGALDISRENNQIFLVFSEGAEATIIIQLSEDEPGKISSLELQETDDEHSAQSERQAILRQRVRGLESLGMNHNEEALETFSETHLTATLRNDTDRETLFSTLRTIGRASAGAGTIAVVPGDEGIRLSFRGSYPVDVFFSLEEDEPFRIQTLTIDTEPEEEIEQEAASVAPITWDNLSSRLSEEETDGFSGTILIARDGRIVQHEGYGSADIENGVPNTTETIFGIGSTPIDFTRTAILLLMDEGALSLSDKVSRFFPDIPQDKASITIEHLMTGKSGLPNFHHDPSTDEDYDLTWINRDEALRRIFSANLLFEPGEDNSHSHSAFVALAAVVEVVSGQTYADFLSQRFFEPLEMRNTGFYGADERFEPDQVATGYGMSRVGEVNKPLYWGPTSWLVMGSGGMVSNPGDMYRWISAVHIGHILSDEAREIYGSGGVLAGGSDRGFLFIYIDDPQNTVLLSSNTHRRSGDHAEALARALIELVTDYK